MSIYLRLVNNHDVDLLFHWANQDSVRMNSFNSQKIPYEDHVVWFSKAISNPDIAMYILEDCGIPVAQIRLVIERDNETATINYSVSEEHQGLGYGKKIISLVDHAPVINSLQIKRLIAKVKASNTASVSVFRSNGYREIFIEDNVFTFQKEL